jgi:hypothetical protein
MISISHVLFLAGITVVLLMGTLDYMGVPYDAQTKLLYAVGAGVLILASYVFFLQVDEIDFFDFVSAMVFTSEVRSTARGRLIDASATQVYLGIVLVSVAPILYTLTRDVMYSALALAIGGILVALGAVGYMTAGKLD